MESNGKIHKETITEIVAEMNDPEIGKFTLELLANYKLTLHDVHYIKRVIACSTGHVDACTNIFILGMGRGCE